MYFYRRIVKAEEIVISNKLSEDCFANSKLTPEFSGQGCFKGNLFMHSRQQRAVTD